MSGRDRFAPVATAVGTTRIVRGAASRRPVAGARVQTVWVSLDAACLVEVVAVFGNVRYDVTYCGVSRTHRELDAALADADARVAA